MSRVSTTLSADAASYIREMQKINAELVKNRQELEKLATANNKLANEAQASAREQEGISDRMINSVASWAASLVTVGAAYRAITAEMQNQLEKQQKMAAAQNTVAAAEQRLAMNARTPQEFQSLREMAQNISRASSVPLQATIDAVAAANSARGNAPISAVESAARIAARAQPNNVSEIPGIASALLDARLITRSDDARENYGKLAALQSVSRPVSLGTTARYLIPSAVGAQSILKAENQYDWLAAAAMMTGASADPSGEKTGGASQVIAGKMAQFFREPGSFGGDKGASALNEYVLHQASGGAMPEAGRMRRFLQNNQYYRDMFLQDAKLGVRAIPGADAMFRPEMEPLIQENIRMLESATAESGEAQLRGMEGTRANRAARTARQAQSATEFAQLGNVRQARLGAIRTEFGNIQQALGYSAISRAVDWGGVALGGMISESAQVEELRSQLQRANRYAATSSLPEHRAASAQIERLIATLTTMAAEIRNGNRAPTNVGPPEIK